MLADSKPTTRSTYLFNYRSGTLPAQDGTHANLGTAH